MTGGARCGAAPCRHRVARTWQRDDGAQTLELALAMPFVALAVALVLQAGVLAADVVAAQTVALHAARVAAVDDDDAVREAVENASARRPVDVRLDPPDARRRAGDLVTATVRLRSRAFGGLGRNVWIPARAVLRAERP